MEEKFNLLNPATEAIIDEVLAGRYGDRWSNKVIKKWLGSVLTDPAILNAQGLMPIPQWMKTSEGMPPDYGPIWFFVKGKVVHGNYHEIAKEFVGYMGAYYPEAIVTHWMPFIQPKPPKIG